MREVRIVLERRISPCEALRLLDGFSASSLKGAVDLGFGPGFQSAPARCEQDAMRLRLIDTTVGTLRRQDIATGT